MVTLRIYSAIWQRYVPKIENRALGKSYGQKVQLTDDSEKQLPLT